MNKTKAKAKKCETYHISKGGTPKTPNFHFDFECETSHVFRMFMTMF